MAEAIDGGEFAGYYRPLALAAEVSGDVAVAVSGGPDSMASLTLVAEYMACGGGGRVYALIVDHGLRTEAAREAQEVARECSQIPNVLAVILKWEHEEMPQARILEAAREARYSLLHAACRERGVQALVLGHHRDDQAETVLFRLAKGSGLNGLGGMRAVQRFGDDLVLLRPLLDVGKERLIATCEARGIGYVRDPSNEKLSTMRGRMRGAQEVLEAEGLTSERLSRTAKRLARADEALDVYAEQAFQGFLIKNTDQIVLDFEALRDYPEEIILRVVMIGYNAMCARGGYGPRLMKFEALVEALYEAQGALKRTLGGAVFVLKEGALNIFPE